MTANADAALAARLLAWYDRAARRLPWRRDRDPYRVLVSEVMLQQTRVETALGRYEAFLHSFSTVGALAAATEDEVLAAWSGLGYYGRARRLHAAARQIVAAGKWPTGSAGWRRLPGIGPYSAAALASIVDGERVAALDGNVVRVASRLVAESGSPDRAAVRRRLEGAVRALLDPRRPGDGNQALMELGATLCRPQAPRCEPCPLAGGCAAAAAGEAERYPRRARAAPPRRVRQTLAVVEREGRLLLFRRAASERLLAGFWELPWAPGTGRLRPERALSRRYGGVWRLGPVAGRVAHAITTRRIEATVRAAELEEAPGVAEGAEAAWLAAEELTARPVSALVTKAVRVWRER